MLISNCQMSDSGPNVPLTLSFFNAKPHSSVGSFADLRTGSRLFDSRLCQYSFRGLMIVRIHTPLTAVRCFENCLVGKQPVAWKESCADDWLKKLQDRVDRCTGRRDITDILLKTALNTIQIIKQSCFFI